MADNRTRQRSPLQRLKRLLPLRRTKKTRKTSSRKRAPRWLRYGALALGFVVAVPFVLTAWAAVLPPVSTLMMRDLVTLRGYERDWIALDEAAPVLLHSVIASEDQRFCAHDGVEWEELWNQFERWRAGDDARGASTLTMQVARNLFLWQGRSPVRKALEVPLATWLDFVLSKRRLMEIYINVVELRPRIYGFEAASMAAFDRSAADVSRRQAALLVAALPLPAERDAARPTRRQAALADIIAGRARQMGAYIGCLQPPEPAS